MKSIGIACDHAGYELKEFLVGYLSSKGYEVTDFGTDSEQSVDYPDFAHPLAEAVASGELPAGIGICGSGEGMAITLNKFLGTGFEGGRHERRIAKIDLPTPEQQK